MRFFVFGLMVLCSMYLPAQSKAETELVVDKIMLNLERLESNYLVKLNRRDYIRASVLMENIYSLLKNLREPEIFAMDDDSFRILKDAVKEESFSSNRIEIIKTAASSNYFTVQQVSDIAGVLTYSDERVKAIEIMYPWVIDKTNSFRLLSGLQFLI